MDPNTQELLMGASGSSVPSDVDFENTVLLLHGDGTNGAQNNTFIDGSTNNFTITRNGNTTQGTFSPFGDRWSNFNPDSAGGLGVASNAALNMGTGDFTVEAWVNTSKLPTTNQFITTPGGFQSIFGTGPNQSGTGTQLYIGVTNIKFDISNDFSGPIDVAHNMVAGQWYHVAITRSGNTFRAFINGILLQTGTSSASWNDGFNYGILRAEPIGGFDGAWWYGYVSNFRLIKGTAVYTSAFTPPTAPLTAIANTSLLTCQSNRFIDNSTNNFTITPNGDVRVEKFNPFGRSAPYSSSNDGGSGYFDGSGDYLSTGANSAFGFESGDFTMECWFYKTTSNLDVLLDTRINAGGSQFGLALYVQGNTLKAGNNAERISGGTVTNNSWNHCALIRSGNNISLYLNGLRTNTTAFSTTLASSASCWIGSSAFSEFAGGYISNARAVKGTAVYTGTTYTIPTAPLTAISNTSLLLNFTNAGVIDNTGLNVLETVDNAQIDTGIKKFGTGSLKFDGNDNLVIPWRPSLELGASSFTIEFWIYIIGGNSLYCWSTDWHYAMSWNYGGANANRVGIWASSNGSTWNIFNADGGGNGISTGTISTSTWTHVALVRNGSSWALYLNGTSAWTGTSSATIITRSTDVFRIGGPWPNSGPTQLNGYIDDFRITNGIARYTANFTPPTAPFPDF